jgi:ABC-2 type transport system ATP-binding protein
MTPATDFAPHSVANAGADRNIADTAIAAADVAIAVEGLTKSFDGRRVVHDLSMQVKRGAIYGFLGANGSGKTTTIRMLCGLLTPDAGRGTCLGFDIATETSKIKRHVGYMTQRFSLYHDLSVRENLEFVARIYGVADPAAAARATIARMSLESCRDQLAGSLSGGWKQRLALGACTLPGPRLLLLDEPTAGMGREDIVRISALIRAASASCTVLMVEHNLSVVADLCDRITVLTRGRVLAEGDYPTVSADPAVREAYLGTGHA